MLLGLFGTINGYMFRELSVLTGCLLYNRTRF